MMETTNDTQTRSAYALIFQAAADAASVAGTLGFRDKRLGAYEFESTVSTLVKRRPELARAINAFGMEPDGAFVGLMARLKAARDGVSRLQALDSLVGWLRRKHETVTIAPAGYPAGVSYCFLMDLVRITIQAACCRNQDEWAVDQDDRMSPVSALKNSSAKLQTDVQQIAAVLEASGVPDQLVAEFRRSVSSIRLPLPLTQVRALRRLFLALAAASFGQPEAQAGDTIGGR